MPQEHFRRALLVSQQIKAAVLKLFPRRVNKFDARIEK